MANSNLARKAPDVFRMLEKMKIDIEFLTDTFLYSENQNKIKLSPRELAQKFLLSYPEKWTFWVSADVQKQVKKALRAKDQNEPTGR